MTPAREGVFRGQFPGCRCVRGKLSATAEQRRGKAEFASQSSPIAPDKSLPHRVLLATQPISIPDLDCPRAPGHKRQIRAPNSSCHRRSQGYSPAGRERSDEGGWAANSHVKLTSPGTDGSQVLPASDAERDGWHPTICMGGSGDGVSWRVEDQGGYFAGAVFFVILVS
ncbi:MAG: hypothetical protein KatS3mg111_2012 [Pirellulaceae bacterium]|nr:MAG: hypothetical protein KatS3mg111_2012 [Pirellulaceae bacterium]